MKSAVCFFAHPDDETVLAGGIIHLLTQHGIKVHIVSATRGEGGELGEPPVVTRDNLGVVRERELQCAALVLGASVSFMNYVDPLITEGNVLHPFVAEFSVLAQQCGTLARQYDADLVLTHGSDGEYGHPAHKLMHEAAKLGVRQLQPHALIYSVAATVPAGDPADNPPAEPDSLWNKSDRAHFALDVTPWAQVKIDAMQCHYTQHALFKRRRKLETVAEAVRTLESVRRVWPFADEAPQDDFGSLLRKAGAAVIG